MVLKAILEKTDYETLPPDVQKEYTERNGKYEVQVEGMKTEADVTRVTTALTKERADHKAVRDRVAMLGDRKIEDVLVQLERIPELELAAEGKMDDKKINTIVETRIASKLAPVVRERDQLVTSLAAKDKVIGELSERERSRVIHDAIRVAAGKIKVLPEALDDALLLGERVFDIEEGTGRVITKDKIGVIPGIEPDAWFQDLQTKRPHWWGASTGGGGTGNDGKNNGGGSNPFSNDHWNLTAQGEVVKTNPTKADQLARAAGTTVGGPRPAAKK